MNGTTELGLYGTLVKRNVEWLEAHALCDERGVLRCAATNERIHASIIHLYRPRGRDAPFVREGDSALSSATDLEMISLRWFSCPGCGTDHAGPEKLALADLVRF